MVRLIVGWTCPPCEDLRDLLTIQQRAEINVGHSPFVLDTENVLRYQQWIQSLGSQSTLTLAEYISTRLQLSSSIESHPDEFHRRIKTLLKFDFTGIPLFLRSRCSRMFLRSMADVTVNRLSQDDLLMLETSLALLSTSPKHLVHALTPWELYRLSQLFTLLSSSDTQCISRDRFDGIFHTYLPLIMSGLTAIEKVESEPFDSHSIPRDCTIESTIF